MPVSLESFLIQNIFCTFAFVKRQGTDIGEILKDFNEEVFSLKKTVSEEDTEVSRLNRLDTFHQKEMHETRQEISLLKKENQQLKNRIAKYEKSGSNSIQVLCRTAGLYISNGQTWQLLQDENASIFAKIHSITEAEKKNGNLKYNAILVMS